VTADPKNPSEYDCTVQYSVLHTMLVPHTLVFVARFALPSSPDTFSEILVWYSGYTTPFVALALDAKVLSCLMCFCQFGAPGWLGVLQISTSMTKSIGPHIFAFLYNDVCSGSRGASIVSLEELEKHIAVGFLWILFDFGSGTRRPIRLRCRGS
jgi:hypothetical protein